MAKEFDLSKLTSTSKTVTDIKKGFEKAGMSVVGVEVAKADKKVAGIRYREIMFMFADSQNLIMRIKETGDFYQVLLNKKLTPVKHQDKAELNKAIQEIAQIVKANSAKYQKLLARRQMPKPTGIKSPLKKANTDLTGERDQLKQNIEKIDKEIGEWNAMYADVVI